MAFKHGNHTLIDLDAGNDTKITSATGQDIVFYPDQHIWIKQGTKLIFEGTVPDDFEAKLQATSVTADNHTSILFPASDSVTAPKYTTFKQLVLSPSQTPHSSIIASPPHSPVQSSSTEQLPSQSKFSSAYSQTQTLYYVEYVAMVVQRLSAICWL